MVPSGIGRREEKKEEDEILILIPFSTEFTLTSQVDFIPI